MFPGDRRRPPHPPGVISYANSGPSVVEHGPRRQRPVSSGHVCASAEGPKLGVGRGSGLRELLPWIDLAEVDGPARRLHTRTLLGGAAAIRRGETPGHNTASWQPGGRGHDVTGVFNEPLMAAELSLLTVEVGVTPAPAGPSPAWAFSSRWLRSMIHVRSFKSSFHRSFPPET